MAKEIPFNRPYITGKELYYIARAVTEPHLVGDGRYTKACARLLEQQFGINKVLMTPSATAALEMGAILADVGPDDEVILPSYTFVSTANAFVRLGAKPIFVDIRPETLNIDEDQIEQAITPRTKAIFPVHYAGISCEMEKIMQIAKRHNLVVVEDAAQGVNSFYEGRALGSIGHMGAYSFHETKNYACGEGGALCINSPEMIERAEIIREKGTNRSRFFRGEVDKYTWVDAGSSYIPSELSSAFLYAQLENLDTIKARRREVYQFYRRHLKPYEAQGLFKLPQSREECEGNFHMFYVIMPSMDARDALMNYLKQQGIRAVFHYVPLHTAPMGEKFGYRAGDLPVTEDLSGRLLRLPFFCDLTEDEQTFIVDHIVDFTTQKQVRRMAA